MIVLIEFVVVVFGVFYIVVCGYIDCGVMKGVIKFEGFDVLFYVKEWLGYCCVVIDVVKECCGIYDLLIDYFEVVIKENVV